MILWSLFILFSVYFSLTISDISSRAADSESQERADHCDHNSRKHICNFQFLFPQQVDPHTEDQHRACQRKIGKCALCHDRLDRSCKKCNHALKYSYRNCRKDASFSHGCSHHTDNEHIQHGFEHQSGMVSGNAVLD